MPGSQRSLLRVALHGAGLQQRRAGLPGAEFCPETRGSRELLIRKPRRTVRCAKSAFLLVKTVWASSEPALGVEPRVYRSIYGRKKVLKAFLVVEACD